MGSLYGFRLPNGVTLFANMLIPEKKVVPTFSFFLKKATQKNAITISPFHKKNLQSVLTRRFIMGDGFKIRVVQKLEITWKLNDFFGHTNCEGV